MEKKKKNLKRLIRPAIFLTVGLLHVAALLYFKINIRGAAQQDDPEEAMLIKLVDIQEYEPPPEPKEIPEETIEVAIQPTASENIIEVEEEVIESEDAPEINSLLQEPEYLPQHLISKIPDIPTETILDQIEYPPMALRQGIEAVVYLELFIDKYGNIRRIEVLRDPGFGFADSAIEALQDIQCSPAESNGTPVAVRFRYPIRFTLQ